jgi:hypothetical protein
MALSKKQKEDRIHFWVVTLGCFLGIGITAIVVLKDESKPDQEKVDPGYTIFENSDSLEITNPKYLEEHFDTL